MDEDDVEILKEKYIKKLKKLNREEYEDNGSYPYDEDIYLLENNIITKDDE
jgi:hypothetical protein